MKKKILITGGAGFVGRKLAKLLIEKGYQVSILSRQKRQNTATISYYQWDVEMGVIEEQAILDADVIINLAGENIAQKRWTQTRKKQLVDSRVNAIQLIHQVLQAKNKKIDSFISASGIGIYGAFTSNKTFNENSKLANDFLGETCQKWEAATDSIASLNIRTVIIRTGLVLGKNDGFLSKLIPVFKYRLGSVIGTGQQYMPWIHIHDLCGIYAFAVENEQVQGPYNAAVKDGTTNALFSSELAKQFGYKIFLPNISKILIRILMGEMATIILKGQRVSPQKIIDAGFQFKYTTLSQALKNCLKN